MADGVEMAAWHGGKRQQHQQRCKTLADVMDVNGGYGNNAASTNSISAVEKMALKK